MFRSAFATVKSRWVIRALVAFSCYPLNATEVEFPAGKNCVAWKTKKRMFLVRTVEPVGVSCEVKVEWSEQNGKNRIHLVVPVTSFNSNEPDRDKEVVVILGGNAYPNIEVTSEVLTSELKTRFSSGDKFQLKAELEVSGRKVEKSFDVVRTPSGTFAIAMVQTSFRDFAIEPPMIAGGAVAKVSDYLELHGQIMIPEEVLKP